MLLFPFIKPPFIDSLLPFNVDLDRPSVLVFSTTPHCNTFKKNPDQASICDKCVVRMTFTHKTNLTTTQHWHFLSLPWAVIRHRQLGERDPDVRLGVSGEIFLSPSGATFQEESVCSNITDWTKRFEAVARSLTFKHMNNRIITQGETKSSLPPPSEVIRIYIWISWSQEVMTWCVEDSC